jgi:hypothetical protein
VINSNGLQSIVLPANTVFGSATAQTASCVHENIARASVNYGFQ